jgi:hypothetical protein
MLKSRITFATIALTAAFASLPTGALARAGARTKTPTITARPASAMVDSKITLRGSGFPSHTTVRLRECGQRSWLDPQVPCNVENETSVTTGAGGRFATTFKVEVCPEGEPIGVITQRRCYVGVPEQGEDTGALEPSVEVAVSYP